VLMLTLKLLEMRSVRDAMVAIFIGSCRVTNSSIHRPCSWGSTCWA
jgi:hypothetical protein